MRIGIMFIVFLIGLLTVMFIDEIIGTWIMAIGGGTVAIYGIVSGIMSIKELIEEERNKKWKQ